MTILINNNTTFFCNYQTKQFYVPAPYCLLFWTCIPLHCTVPLASMNILFNNFPSKLLCDDIHDRHAGTWWDSQHISCHIQIHMLPILSADVNPLCATYSLATITLRTVTFSYCRCTLLPSCRHLIFTSPHHAHTSIRQNDRFALPSGFTLKFSFDTPSESQNMSYSCAMGLINRLNRHVVVLIEGGSTNGWWGEWKRVY